jgi:hypothetical protein
MNQRERRALAAASRKKTQLTYDSYRKRMTKREHAAAMLSCFTRTVAASTASRARARARRALSIEHHDPTHATR